MKMQIKPLVDAIQRVTQITGTAIIGLRLSKRVLSVTGENAGCAMQVKLAYDDPGEWEFTIAREVLTSVFKGRAELDITVEDGTRIWFAAKTFKADFSTQPFGTAPEMERKDSVEITDAQQEQIEVSLNLASLSPIHEGDTQFCVSFSKAACYAGCFDDLHFAFVESPGLKGPDLAFALPTSTFGIIAKAAAKSQYHTSTTSAAICAWNKDFELVLPFVQRDVQQTIEDVQGMAGKFGRALCLIDKRELLDAITAAQVVCSDGSAVKLHIKNGLATVTSSSNIGTVSEQVVCKTKGSGEMMLDPVVTLGILHQAPNGPIEVGTHDDRFFFVRAQEEEHKIVYGGMLSSSED